MGLFKKLRAAFSRGIDRVARAVDSAIDRAVKAIDRSGVADEVMTAAAVRHAGGSFSDAYRAVRSLRITNDNKARVGMDLVTTIIGFIIVFYVVAYTYSPLEDAGTTLKNNLGNSSITGVQNISSLPEVAILLFILLVILGLILAATKSTE